VSRVIYVTVKTPLGRFEEFIIPEMVELLRKVQALIIAPRSPSGRRVVQDDAEDLQDSCVYQPLLSGVILRACIQQLVQNHVTCLRLLLRILLTSRTLFHLLKNLVVFPKGLWLARLAKAWGADHIHAHWALSTATMAMIAGEIADIPWSFTAHRGDIVDNNMLREKVQSAVFVRFISHKALRLAQSIMKCRLPAKCHVIHMGVELPRVASLNERGDGRSFTIMCPASLLPVKGHTYLMQAVAALKERGVSFQLLLAGEGPLAASLHRQVDELEIQDRVKFLGYLSHHALLQYYKEKLVDLVVLPSVDLGNGEHEGIPVSLMEAMSYGIPVIATDTGGIPELLGNDAGILVPPTGSVALAGAIECLAKNIVLREHLGTAGRKRIMDEFAVENTVHQLTGLMNSTGERRHKEIMDEKA
jgi:colanic acid/amylovoran biosynthesis glycosyltransferase